MEPQKRAKLSKSLDPDEIEEVLMDEESDEELEDKVMERRVQSSSSSEDEDDEEETEVAFQAARADTSCGGKLTHKKFREILVRELIYHSQEENVTVALQGVDQVQWHPSSVGWK